MFEARWRRVTLAITAIVSGIVLVYVISNHFLAYQNRMSVAPRDYREGFGTRDGLPDGFTSRSKGNLTTRVAAGIVTVEGVGHAGDEVVLVGPERRFDDSVLALRFRTPPGDPVEIFVGIEQSDQPRSAIASYVVGPSPMIAVGGDLSGPFRSRKTNDERRLDASANGDWHLLAFQFTPMYAFGSALLDGVPLSGATLLWPQATKGHLVCGVRIRGDLPHAKVELDSLALTTLDQTLSSFHEDFKGELLDPQRWVAVYPDRELATLDLQVTRKGGLSLETNVLAMPGENIPLYLIRTVPFPLTSLRAKVDVTITELTNSRFFVGLMGSSAWAPMDRVFDVGIIHRNGVVTIDVAGAWTVTGSINFDVGPNVELPHRMKIDLRYDAPTATGEAWVDGKLLAKHLLDLKPLDPISLRFGSGSSAVGARSKVVVNEVEVEMH